MAQGLSTNAKPSTVPLHERPNPNTRGSSARPSSQCQPKAVTTRLDLITSGKEFGFQNIDDEDDTPDPPSPSNDLPALVPTIHQPVGTIVTTNMALEFVHFFTKFKPPAGTKGNEKVQKVCKLCISVYGDNKDKYNQAIVEYKWKYRLSTQSDIASTHKNAHNIHNHKLPSFSLAAFLEHLVCFVIANDQLCMVLRKTLIDADIPGHDKMREAVISHWRRLFEDLKLNLSSSGCLTLKAALIGIHCLKKKHSGINIAKAILHLLNWADVTLKTAINIGFDHLNHYVRCYTHIINICSSHIIASVTSTSKVYLPELEEPTGLSHAVCDNSNDESDDGDSNCDIDGLELTADYNDEGNPKLREGFCAFIQDGNQHSWFTTRDNDGRRTKVQVPELQPLRDAIDWYFETELADFSTCKLLESDWKFLEGLEVVLMQSISSELMPVLSHAIANFKMLMTKWEKLGKQHKILTPWTEISLHWATKYYIRMDDTDVYVVTMFLNPAMHFSWIQSEWETKYIQNAKDIVLKLPATV
ncbi:hypothetical protein BJY52DRAFT_1224346 [Lactarius psammicola]|nr:hypothetical protein BJY52DRAFT_1224346 [Lactarius psammicola]